MYSKQMKVRTFEAFTQPYTIYHSHNVSGNSFNVHVHVCVDDMYSINSINVLVDDIYSINSIIYIIFWCTCTCICVAVIFSKPLWLSFPAFLKPLGQYRGARVLYSPYIPRSHGTYNIFYS